MPLARLFLDLAASRSSAAGCVVTCHPHPNSPDEMSATFQSSASKFQDVAGLLRRNYFVSEDGRRAGGIYVWASLDDADRLYTAEWKQFVEGKYGARPTIEYLHSPMMVDNRDRTIIVS